MKQASEIDNALLLKTLWAKMMVNGPTGLAHVMKPYEDLLCETFNGCWLQKLWHMPIDDSGDKYKLSLEVYDGRKCYYTLWCHTDEDGKKEDSKMSWDIFFWELVLNRRFIAHGTSCKYSYFESADLNNILEKIS